MTRKWLCLTIAAMLAALMFSGCGVSVESNIDDSSSEGLKPFGLPVDVSAQPSMGQVTTEQPANVSQNAEDPNGTVEGNTGGSPVDVGNGTGNGTTNGQPSAVASQPNTTAVVSSAPAISPPAGASGATMEQAREYVGKPLSDFMTALGYPYRSDYKYVDENDPSKGEIGTLYFIGGYTITTLRTSEGETITEVSPESETRVTPALDDE